MPNLGMGALDISLAGILLYVAVAFGWRKLNYIWSAIITIGAPFLYNLLLASIQSSALHTPINMPLSLLMATLIQLIVALGVFYYIRKEQSNGQLVTTVLVIAGFIILFMVVPSIIGLVTRFM